MKNNKITAILSILCLVMLAGAVSVSAHSNDCAKIDSGDFDEFGPDSGQIVMFAGSDFIEQEYSLDAELEDDICFQKASKEDKELVKKLFEEEEEIYNKYQKEYEALDREDEKIFDSMENVEDEKVWDEVFEKIDAKYEALDKKTGIDKINAGLDRLYEKNNCDELYASEFDSEFVMGVEMTDEQMKQVETVEKQIDTAYKKNADAYEKLDKQMEELEQEYQKLDEKTGITKLYEQLENLMASFWN